MGTHAIGAREVRSLRGISLFDINNERRNARASLSPSSPVDSNRYNDLARYRLKHSSSSVRDEERGRVCRSGKSRYLIAETLPLMLLLPPLLARGHLVLLITCHSTRVINDFALSSRAPSYLVPRHLPLLFCHCYYFAADPFLSFSLARKIVQSMTRKMNIRRGNEQKIRSCGGKKQHLEFSIRARGSVFILVQQ